MDLLKLLEEKRKRQAFSDQLFSVVALGYNLVDKKTPARQCTRAGHFYDFVSIQMNLPNSGQFKSEVRQYLLESGLVRYQHQEGYFFIRGLVAKDPKQDLEWLDKSRAKARLRQKKWNDSRKLSTNVSP